MPQSRITNIQGSGTFESQYGTLYSFIYTFEDNVTLQANHKSQQPPFKVGDVAEYEVTRDNEYGKSGKVKKPEQQQQKAGGYKKPEGNNRSFALSYAKDFAIAKIATGEKLSADDVTIDAEVFLKWLDNTPRAVFPQIDTNGDPF